MSARPGGVEGRQRVVIEDVSPQIDGGRFPIKRIVGDQVTVEAAVFADGRDRLFCQVVYCSGNSAKPLTFPMSSLGNDRWQASFTVETVGTCRYAVEGWIDHFKTWREDMLKRVNAQQDLSVDLLVGADLIEKTAARAVASDGEALRGWAKRLRVAVKNSAGLDVAFEEQLLDVMQRYPDPLLVTRYEKNLEIVVDREKARFSTWYELFPRSCAPESSKHGTFRDCEARLPYIASMGFDVLYLPPIHPIGSKFRKGKNNSVTSTPDDAGSPWAIGSAEGGHKSIHPQLGNIDDFRSLIAKASDHGLEMALDIAFQCSPDHPYVKEHPEFFSTRPDGTIQYAENPPKKYQDIYPLNFEIAEWRALWNELRDIFLYWAQQGVRIFRVDNPHTKPFAFWEWVIAEVKSQYPDAIFLAEAFTRPHVMYRLAKLGFSQSYSYFAWRNTKQELTEYFTELNETPVSDFFRPNLWPNTPDILTETLQAGGPPAFLTRLVLAATLGANYGIYGPAYELYEHTPAHPGSEEYLDSEKYEIKQWDLDSPQSLAHRIAVINDIRRKNKALQSNDRLHFHEIDNPMLICYSKSTPDLSNVVLTIANLDPFFTQSGWTHIDLSELGITQEQTYSVIDLLNGGRYSWKGPRNYVALTPGAVGAHIFKIER